MGPLPLVLLGAGVLLLAGMGAGPSPTPEAQPHPGPYPGPQPPEPDLDEVPDPSGAAEAFIRQVIRQGGDSPKIQQLSSMAINILVEHGAGWSAVVLPCGEGYNPALHADTLRRIGTAIADAYGSAYHAAYVAPGGCVTYFSVSGTSLPSAEQVIAAVGQRIDSQQAAASASFGSEEYGFLGLEQIFSLIIATVIATLTSMAVQDMVDAAGGSRRLARLVRRYKKRMARTGETAQQILDRCDAEEKSGKGGKLCRLLGKLRRTAARIKGRTVDWNELGVLIGEYDAATPGV